MARKKRAREPTREEWDATIEALRALGDLDQAEFRVKVEKLARELEHQGHRAHRDADRLEGLSFFRYRTSVRASEYARSAILGQLARWYKERHLRLVKVHLD